VIGVVYHELRHIDVDGALLKHDIEDWSDMVRTLGENWATSKANIIASKNNQKNIGTRPMK
jgi:hypothetical protein